MKLEYEKSTNNFTSIDIVYSVDLHGKEFDKLILKQLSLSLSYIYIYKSMCYVYL